ncbi:lycopene beta-cyclase CrtY [Novosphingobium sp.]|uniref:lycopene beta-cyclase CrtY n=1 Tax=Novosphingobium sp. TaxID=1874826 RepID=UPI0035B2D2C6
MATGAPLVIVGGGLAGSLAALCLAERRPDIPLLLLERGERFGGDHTWSFFDSDVPQAAGALVAALEPMRWRRHRVRFESRVREFAVPYNSVQSAALDTLVRSRLPAGQWRTGIGVALLEAEAVVLTTGERIAARGVIDARGPQCAMPGLNLGWQKFVGIEFAAAHPEPDCAEVMDATVPQCDGYRFVYTLPLAARRVLIEDTYYSDTPDLPVAIIAERVRVLAAERGLLGAELRRETGVLPILLGGDPAVFWPSRDPVARLGLAGGFFHATTGYSFGLAMQLAAELAALPGRLDGPDLARWSRARFLQCWREMRFFRLLNRMLFGAAPPDQRHRIFAHFYRLSPALIARFYAGQLTRPDCLRILSGRPPVPVLAALRAMVRG